MILSVNDQAINGNLSAYVDAWQTGDAPLRVTWQRGGEQVELQDALRPARSGPAHSSAAVDMADAAGRTRGGVFDDA
ncbi:MAG: hypothetical protein V8Q82_04545, partial [Christensenellales bacterium]